MERKLIANSLVPDNEVWVSPKTWDSPFTQSKVAQNSTDIQQLKAKIRSIRKRADGRRKLSVVKYRVILYDLLNELSALE